MWNYLPISLIVFSFVVKMFSSEKSEDYFNTEPEEPVLDDNVKEIDRITGLLSLDPYNANNYIIRGHFQSQLSNDVLAIEDLDQAIELDPYNSTAFYNRATVYYNLENYEKTIHCIK